MPKELRISAGAIVIKRGRILLVRHGAAFHRRDFLVGPGGGVESEETTPQAAVREVKEETGLDVSTRKILFVEDMISRHKRVLKVWFLCEVVGGRLVKTRNATQEGIVEAGWYRQGELQEKVVYPAILLNTDWHLFFQEDWETRYLESRDADADF